MLMHAPAHAARGAHDPPSALRPPALLFRPPAHMFATACSAFAAACTHLCDHLLCLCGRLHTQQEGHDSPSVFAATPEAPSSEARHLGSNRRSSGPSARHAVRCVCICSCVCVCTCARVCMCVCASVFDCMCHVRAVQCAV